MAARCKSPRSGCKALAWDDHPPGAAAQALLQLHLSKYFAVLCNQLFQHDTFYSGSGRVRPGVLGSDLRMFCRPRLVGRVATFPPGLEGALADAPFGRESVGDGCDGRGIG